MTKQLYGSETIISARQRSYEREYIARIILDARQDRLLELDAYNFKSYKVQWRYFGRDERKEVVEYETWEEIPEGQDIIIRMNAEEL